MAEHDISSPLFNSSAAVANGGRRSDKKGLRISASFPIKKIAFNRSSADDDSSNNNSETEEVATATTAPSTKASILRAEERGRQRAYEEHGEESIMRSAAEAVGGTKKRYKKHNFDAGEEKVEISAEHDEEYDIVQRMAHDPPTSSPRSELYGDDNATDTSKSSKMKRLFRRKKKKKKDELTPDEQAINEAKALMTRGAWMCGVCGTPFDTAENATAHEDVCYIEWCKHDNLVREKWADEGVEYYIDDVPIQFLEGNFLPPYPEYVPPKSRGEIQLSSPLVRRYMIMTDQLLHNIGDRSTDILHAQVEKDLKALALKKQRYFQDPSLADDYTEEDAQIHEELFMWMREYDAMREIELQCQERHDEAHEEQLAYEERHGVQPNLTHYDYYYRRLNRIAATGSDAFDDEMADEEDGAEESGEEKEKAMLQKFNHLWSPVKGRFEHAYKLVKEGPKEPGAHHHQKRRAQKDSNANNSNNKDMTHDNNTLFINVVVKNSVQVVNHELQRMAKGWWQSEQDKKGGGGQTDGEEIKDFQFEWIRNHTQKKVIQLAGLALASDFTPRKVAVQLSNDLYRLLEPQLKPKGVTIQTVIEYREGQYFVLAVNIVEIDWVLLMKWVVMQQTIDPTIALGRSRSVMKLPAKKKKKKVTLQSKAKDFVIWIKQRFPSRNEVIAFVLYTLYNVHEFISVPILRLCYFLFMRYAVNKFILNAVTDDIFRYVEKKGMEMQLGIKNNNDQASFMLAALREIRSGGQKGHIEDDYGDEDAKPIIGPLMGVAIKGDNNPVQPPSDFTPPDVLEFVGLETDLSAGFLRLRWALLHTTSSFFKDAFLQEVLNYDKIEIGQWSSNENDIGLPKPRDGVDERSFLNATMEYSYLMPKSAFVKANMCYATLELIHYDNYCLCIKEKTLTPEVPYGNTFVSWTQYTIINTGKNTCRMICSVEAEFPNGPPMVARQIKSGMRSGTAEKFVSLGETICRYAEAFP